MLSLYQLIKKHNDINLYYYFRQNTVAEYLMSHYNMIFISRFVLWIKQQINNKYEENGDKLNIKRWCMNLDTYQNKQEILNKIKEFCNKTKEKFEEKANDIKENK